MAAHHRSLLALAWTRTATESPLIPPPMRALGHRNCARVSYGPHVLTQCLGQMSALALAWWARGVRGRWRRWGGATGSAGARGRRGRRGAPGRPRIYSSSLRSPPGIFVKFLHAFKRGFMFVFRRRRRLFFKVCFCFFIVYI